MITSIDQFLERKLDRKNYNCIHLSCDIWQAETGEDLKIRLTKVLNNLISGALRLSTVKAFKRLSKPIHPCFVVMSMPGYQPHVGVYLHGKVLHFQSYGVEYLSVSLASRGFKTVRYFQ